MSRPEACSGDRLDFLPLKSLAKCSRNRILARRGGGTTLLFGLFFYVDFLIVREMRKGEKIIDVGGNILSLWFFSAGEY
jgi:hypothetical protein